MTTIYFVRHAEPLHSHKDDRTRPLTKEGLNDRKIVLDLLKDKKIDVFYCSPYQRSIDTILPTAEQYQKRIITDERLREREKGIDSNKNGMFQKRWADHNYHEQNGESISMVQKRNVEVLKEILNQNIDKNIIIGTHGTALSAILNYYNKDFSCDDFLRIIDWMPYIIELDFDKQELISAKEIGHIKKEYKGNNRADKR